MKISIVGTGNVAYHLAKALSNQGVLLHQLYGRNEAAAIEISTMCACPYTTDISALDATDIVLIAVSDDAIKSVVKSIPEEVKQNSIVAHTSGTKPMGVLKGCEYKAVFYPLQTLSKGIDVDFSGIPICLNGKNKIVKKLSTLARKISHNIRYLSDEQRREAHLSAVIINNFTNHLIYLAKDRLDRLEIDSDILDPLLQETVEKQRKSSSFEAQTGPARRNDQKTILKHLDMLKGDDRLYHLYKEITDSIIKLYS